MNRAIAKYNMPSSSRKKNKGRDRKAKKEAEEAESKRIQMYHTWRSWVIGKSIGIVHGKLVSKCNHGFGDELIPERSHPVASFVTSFFMGEELKYVIQKHEEVLKDDDKRKMILNIFISIGTNWMLYDNTNQVSSVAHAIMILERYGETPDYDEACSNVMATKFIVHRIRLDNGISRDLLKFFRKRMNCKCLKKMHLEARKSQPKVGVCFHCKQVKERSLLMACSRCMISQYCSKECQVAASPKHREDCDKYVKAHQQTMANDSS